MTERAAGTARARTRTPWFAAALTALYWQMGHRVHTEVLDGRRAEYGAQIVAAVGRQLEARSGRGFGEKNLRRMVQLATVFPDPEIVATLSRQLRWSHFIDLITIKDPLEREFYAEMCRIERWSVRALRQKIDGMLFERTALSKKPEALIRKELSALREGAGSRQLRAKLPPNPSAKHKRILDRLYTLVSKTADQACETLERSEDMLAQLSAHMAARAAKHPRKRRARGDRR